MAAIRLQGVTKQFGTQMVLDGVSAELRAGETVGLIGTNGSGKTTLFKLIARELEPEFGTITRAKGLGIGYLRQDADVVLDRTLREEVGSVFADLLSMEEELHAISGRMGACSDPVELASSMEHYERVNARFIASGGHTFETRLHEILGGLGFGEADHSLPMSSLSGGQRCRASLAKLLLEERPMLLLDEPTNHLDIDAVRWLEKYLAGHRGGAVIVSHDRYLLDRLCGRIIELSDRRLTSFPGNYTNYATTREIRLLSKRRQLQKDQEFIKKERAFIAKHIAGQRTAEAKGRRTRLERRLEAGEIETERSRADPSANLVFDHNELKGGTVIRCDDLGARYGEKVLFQDLTLQVRAGDRLGITGPNGTGKTTLLNILVGKRSADSGRVSFEQTLEVGFYAQDPSHLDADRTVVEEIRSARSGFPGGGAMSEQEARSYLARFLFRGDDVFKPLGLLSGGEQSRVRLAVLMLQAPHLLILDEPTNHLDIPSREALEEALREFSGTVIAVSHDRYFLDRVVEKLLVIRPDHWAVYSGNYSFYASQSQENQTRKKSREGSAKSRKKATRANRRDSGHPKSAPSPYDRLSVDKLETMVIDCEVRLAALQERYGDPTVCRDPDALAELGEQIEAVERELSAVDAAWQERVAAQ